MTESRRTAAHFKACLLGGAIGDALGAPIEFDTLAKIRDLHGPGGVDGFHPAYGRMGAITDDTQMTLFTAEGLILARVRAEYSGMDGLQISGYHALLRWLGTQENGLHSPLIRKHGSCAMVDGVLTGFAALHSRRAPGNSCLSALRSEKMGTVADPVNNSKGCGGVMRMAPAGLAFADPEEAFRVGCDLAALTHGHPSGYLAAGCLAALISRIVAGDDLPNATAAALAILRHRPGHAECLHAVTAALELAEETGAPSPERLERLGAGWVAEEALAISLYCALTGRTDFKAGVLLAVNHSGDSDSTGAITGNILGALMGMDAIPKAWAETVELGMLIEEIAGDLFERYGGPVQGS